LRCPLFHIPETTSLVVVELIECSIFPTKRYRYVLVESNLNLEVELGGWSWVRS
jgi:hypothetical protein